ncbi:MAG: heat-inducible transcription repressor HrcA, partial [Actinobacteria bacterium]|nr:heat-inducible transcription repressor HrcA [Actinomycetota bacterium]
PRQQEILRRVVQEYVATGQPVGSKSLVERWSLPVSASTVRNELAELETRGLLTHPHTSAGRVPTERGYRFFATDVLERLEPQPRAFDLELSHQRTEIDLALQTTTEKLARTTRLLALVSGPPLESTTVRHAEVLVLKPELVVVVVITSTGGVSKRMFDFEEHVDPGVAAWAREYLNERVAGVRLGSLMLRNRLDDPGFGPRERNFMRAIAPAFTDLLADSDRLFVGGAAGLLDDVRADELAAYRQVLELLEQRAALVALLNHELAPNRPYVRVGEELEDPALQDVALVGASYGVPNRMLGTVSLLGPLRMDYATAIQSVRGAALALSRFVDEIYADD